MVLKNIPDRTAAVLLILVTAAAWSQSAAPLEFEWSPLSRRRLAMRPHFYGCRGGPGSPDRADRQPRIPSFLIPSAFGVGFTRVSMPKSAGNPPQFEIVAKVPHGATKEQVQQMWQKLLKDRFQLAAHRETREMPVYELVVAKGGFKGKDWVDPAAPADPATSSAQGGPPKRDKDGFPIVQPGQSISFFTGGKAWFVAPGGGIDELVRMLEGRLSIDAPTPKPMIHSTGLTGKYDPALVVAAGRFAESRFDRPAGRPHHAERSRKPAWPESADQEIRADRNADRRPRGSTPTEN